MLLSHSLINMLASASFSFSSWYGVFCEQIHTKKLRSHKELAEVWQTDRSDEHIAAPVGTYKYYEKQCSGHGGNDMYIFTVD
jgi:hypothetical protein